MNARCVVVLLAMTSFAHGLEDPSPGALGQLIPSLANAFLSTLFPKMQLPKEASQQSAGGFQAGPQSYELPQMQQSMRPMGAPLYQMGPNVSPPNMWPGQGNAFANQQNMMPPGDMNQYIPADISENQRSKSAAEANLAQTLWQQSGRKGSPTATANFDNLPPPDFANGYPPVFTRVTNPENQDLFEKPRGLRGRQDLPPNYVYPFAEAGSMVQPGLSAGEMYSLGKMNDKTMVDAEKLFAMANPNLFYPQQNVPMLPQIQQAIEDNEQDQKAMQIFMEKAKQVGMDTGAIGRTNGRVQRTKLAPAKPKEIKPKEQKTGLCSSCINADMEKMVGPWTQIYGNAKAVKLLYSTLINGKQLSDKLAFKETKSTALPSCIGIQVSRPQGQRHHSEMELVFGTDGVDNLHKLQGILKQDRNISAHGKALEMQMTNFKLPLCLVKVGPASSTMYGYMIFTELTGDSRCRSHHVFARRGDLFDRDYSDEVGYYLKREFEQNRMSILSALKWPDDCHAW